MFVKGSGEFRAFATAPTLDDLLPGRRGGKSDCL
jgi:hypothetical protein